MCTYVESGEIDPFDIIDNKKFNNILSFITPETAGSGDIKAQLGDEYSWGEVKMALAYRKTQHQDEIINKKSCLSVTFFVKIVGLRH